MIREALVVMALATPVTAADRPFLLWIQPNDNQTMYMCSEINEANRHTRCVTLPLPNFEVDAETCAAGPAPNYIVCP